MRFTAPLSPLAGHGVRPEWHSDNLIPYTVESWDEASPGDARDRPKWYNDGLSTSPSPVPRSCHLGFGSVDRLVVPRPVPRAAQPPPKPTRTSLPRSPLSPPGRRDRAPVQSSLAKSPLHPLDHLEPVPLPGPR